MNYSNWFSIMYFLRSVLYTIYTPLESFICLNGNHCEYITAFSWPDEGLLLGFNHGEKWNQWKNTYFFKNLSLYVMFCGSLLFADLVYELWEKRNVSFENKMVSNSSKDTERIQDIFKTWPSCYSFHHFSLNWEVRIFWLLLRVTVW